MLGAAFGAAGQRCMALSTAIFVGESREWIPDLAQRASELKIGRGSKEGIDLGPVISPESKERIHSLIAAGIEDGGDLVLDGRNVQVENGENGNFVGPTILKVQKRNIFYFFF
jgi:malonate-semialdehyde dehydrogenase (acetylating)/methylmalonate-semialdehyde dehydrogenase